jgi:hypothetical protein
MDPLGSIDIVDEVAALRRRIVESLIVSRIDRFCLHRPNAAFGITVLARRADCGHTDRHARRPQHLEYCGAAY